MANTLTFDQISTVLNDVVKQATGVETMKATDTSYNLSPNRWYLEIQTRSGGSAAPKSIDIIEDGDEDNPTTGIFECVTDSNGGRTINDNVIYDLNGRAVKRGTSLEGMPSGLYILNGKKIVK